jgi:hypothetical protein
MMRVLICILILATFLVTSYAIFTKEETKTEQTKISSIYPDDKVIGVIIDGQNLKMEIKEDIPITSEGEKIKFSDLDVGNNIVVSYVKENRFLEFRNIYKVKTISKQPISTFR